ncbi:MAG: hypothetical protein UDP17_10940 [Treponema sp.]|uniref:hypothetical protein n=1 Tax=Treponema sp. TaxID=166 RepID=UPI00257B66A3|nr:hypothetical protein [Treponema sp.]MBQ9102294.1 hypothetical protein [Treponema sp.]MEE0353847.1 hypothetical protein [Treponema sp.]
MNKILKILSILVIGFVMFSCSTPTNDPTFFPVEETPEVKTYSISFITENSKHKLFTDYLNTLPEFKNLEEGDEVMLYKHLYCNEDCTEVTTKIDNNSAYNYSCKYYCNNSEIDSVVIENESVEVKVSFKADVVSA